MIIILILLSFTADGVPKEGLRIQDVLVRIATLMLIRDKVIFSTLKMLRAVLVMKFLLQYPFCVIIPEFCIHSDSCCCFSFVVGEVGIREYSYATIHRRHSVPLPRTEGCEILEGRTR